MIKIAVTAALAAALSASPAMSMTNIVSYTVYADGPCDGTEYVPAWIGSIPDASGWRFDKTTWFSKVGGKVEGPQVVSGTPFPARDLMVIGYAFNVQYSHGWAQGWAMAGIKNGLGGDYLIPKEAGAGTWTQMFPAGTGMTLTYGPIQDHHVDMHVMCDGGGTWNATLTLYTVPAASRPAR